LYMMCFMAFSEDCCWLLFGFFWHISSMKEPISLSVKGSVASPIISRCYPTEGLTLGHFGFPEGFVVMELISVCLFAKRMSEK